MSTAEIDTEKTIKDLILAYCNEGRSEEDMFSLDAITLTARLSRDLYLDPECSVIEVLFLIEEEFNIDLDDDTLPINMNQLNILRGEVTLPDITVAEVVASVKRHLGE